MLRMRHTSYSGEEMLTQIVLGRVYDYSRVVGYNSISGPGFKHPIKVALAKGDVAYVLSRGYELIPNVAWNRIGSALRVSKMIIGPTPGDEELVGELCKYGDGEGGLIWPTGIVLDNRENFYITDEWLNSVSIYDQDGKFLGSWGTSGDGDGEFNRPSGIAIDPDEDLYIVDSLNHRVQKFTKDGRFLSKWGSYGSDEGQFDSPWGIGLDHQGHVYVADHKNHRVQKFTPAGEFVSVFGSYGSGRGELNRPTDVAVDPDGDVYVCDWANDRVQVYAPDGKYMTSFIGDAQELSKWGKTVVDSNPDAVKRHREVQTKDPQWRFSMPTGVNFDAEKSRLIVSDNQRHRLQIYDKVKDYVEPQRNL